MIHSYALGGGTEEHRVAGYLLTTNYFGASTDFELATDVGHFYLLTN